MTSRNRGSIYSFGDEGVTASVSALGRLLRVSRHFSGQDFGYCVDHPSIPEPYFVVDRITSLLSMGNDSGESLGIDPKVDILDTGNQPSAEFVHDRWPNFTMRGSNRDITMQFFASGGTIYQTYEFRFQGTDIQPPKLVTAENLLIRQLDFVDFSNRFNEAGIRSSDYETKLSEDQTCIKRSHHVDEGEVVLFIFACCKGELLKFQPNEENQAEEADEEQDNEEDLWAYVHDSEEDQKESKATSKAFGIVWSDKALEDIRAKKSLKLTFAYRLEYLHPRDERDEHVSSVNAEVIEAALQQMDHNPFEEHHFTDNGAINQALRRNLEHILSVCSIPVMAEGDGSGEPAVALTCGDVDGHRVATAASFYCFEFLLLALDYFESCPHRSDYTHWMTQRILKVCRGHLKWLFAKEYRNISKNPSIPHCWVSGKVIDSWDNSLYLPSRSLVDVPFQIIKAGDFSARHTTWEVPKEVGETVQGWIKELDRRNKLGRYAFPRYSKNPTHSFYLTDHVFIWRAVKSVESLKLNSKLKISIQPESEDNEGGQPSKKRTEIRNYSSNHVRNEILRRFTTENPMSKKKMMAVSRSPAHNRFLLRTKDAGLFHAMNLGFFDKPGTEEGRDVWENKIDVWRNLVDSQAYHEDNDDTTWDEPLRFALSFILSQRGMPMNRRPVEQMRSHALSVLTQSTWASGLFPGQLDANKEPILYDDEIMRDTYWAFSFEIPYLLWKFSEASSTGHDAPQTHLKDEAKTDEATTAPGVDSELFKLLKDLLEHQIGAKASTNPTIYTMKHSFPFNNVVDQKNIVELSDEWLYNEPDFFAHGSTGRESLSHPHGDEDCSEGFFPDIQFGWPKIAVVDVPRKRISKKDSPSLVDLITVLEAPSRLKDFMQQKRFRSKAKKRFCASFSSYPKINNAYPQTASEQPAMEAFSKRHMSYDKFFSEVTAAELNKWTTELHLSFYAIDRKGSSISPLMAFQRLSENGSPGGFTRIAMSFRFDGDFFDRYWTCHFLEYDPHMMGDFSVKDKVHDLLLPKGLGWSNDKKEPWRQRRVLELLLFDRIMSKMQEYTADILKEARRNAWEKPAGDTLNAVSGWGQDYQQILQTVEQDLHESLAKVEVWLNREKERMAERPRWTFNDESRYRGIISKLLIINQHRIQELTRCHASISKLNELIRSDLEQRRADDIKRFTYVTVVFLPLGFATGVFSMSEAPVGRTLVSMVVTAAVALAITVVLLKFSERFETLYNRLRRLVISWMIELKTRLVVWRLKPTRTPPAVLPGDPGRPREARGVQNQVEMV